MARSSRSRQPPNELGVSTATMHRWLREGLIPGEQITPRAPWRIQLTDEVRARVCPSIPDGYLPLNEAAKRSASPARPCCIKVQRGELAPSKSTTAAKGPKNPGQPARLDCLINDEREEGSMKQDLAGRAGSRSRGRAGSRAGRGARSPASSPSVGR